MNVRGKNNDLSKGAVSIQDVADAAQVSIATVSRVLNNPAVVSQATATKVREVIDRLGYVPNPFAQGLITRASRVLCFALPDMYGEFYSELIRGADAKAHELGYHLLVSSEARSNPSAGKPGKGGLGLGLADGLAIMITEPSALMWGSDGAPGLPTVVMDVEVHQPGVDCVLVDNTIGTVQACEHLLEKTPAAYIYFVGGSKENFDTKARAEAFTAVLAKAGHQLTPGQISYGDYSVEWGTRWFNALAPDQRTGIGILAGNDEIALGVLHAAQNAGLNVPADVRIVGFDDTRLASLVRPSLSSVRMPMADVGATAITLLTQRIEDPSRQATIARLATRLMTRQSSS